MKMSGHQSERFALVNQRTERYALVDGEERRISCALCPESGGIRIPIVIEVEALPCRRPTRNGITCSRCRHLTAAEEPLDLLMDELDVASVGPAPVAAEQPGCILDAASAGPSVSVAPPLVPVVLPLPSAPLASPPGKFGYGHLVRPSCLYDVLVYSFQ